MKKTIIFKNVLSFVELNHLIEYYYLPAYLPAYLPNGRGIDQLNDTKSCLICERVLCAVFCLSNKRNEAGLIWGRMGSYTIKLFFVG